MKEMFRDVLEQVMEVELDDKRTRLLKYKLCLQRVLRERPWQLGAFLIYPYPYQ